MNIDAAARRQRVRPRNPDQRKIFVSAERSETIEQRFALRILACDADGLFRIGRNEDHDLHAALEDILKAHCYFRNRNRLVLDIDRAAGGIDGLMVLREDRPLAACDVVGNALGARMGVAVTAGMHHALNLHQAAAAPIRQPRRETQFIAAIVAPGAVAGRALAGFVPALDEIVMHVGRRRPCDFHIDVMTFPLSRVAWRAHGSGRQVHSSDKRSLGGLAGVDQPALLMLTIRTWCAVPADTETRTTRSEDVALLGRPCEDAAVADAFLVCPPEDDA